MFEGHNRDAAGGKMRRGGAGKRSTDGVGERDGVGRGSVLECVQRQLPLSPVPPHRRSAKLPRLRNPPRGLLCVSAGESGCEPGPCSTTTTQRQQRPDGFMFPRRFRGAVVVNLPPSCIRLDQDRRDPEKRLPTNHPNRAAAQPPCRGDRQPAGPSPQSPANPGRIPTDSERPQTALRLHCRDLRPA